MNPVKSNLDKEGCIPISSRCVIWQGPDLCCIDVCAEDSLSDVIWRMASKICHLQALLDLSNLDMGTIQVQNKNLITVLQAIINKIETL